jgi:hypothetical protein
MVAELRRHMMCLGIWMPAFMLQRIRNNSVVEKDEDLKTIHVLIG